MTEAAIYNVLANAPHPWVSVPMLISFFGQSARVFAAIDSDAVVTSKLGARQDLHAKLRKRR